jgi:hypothetical protein
MTQALLLQFGAGDGSAAAPVDLESIALEEWSLRGFLGLGAAPRAEPPLATTAPLDPRKLPLLPPPDTGATVVAHGRRAARAARRALAAAPRAGDRRGRTCPTATSSSSTGSRGCTRRARRGTAPRSTSP